MRIANWIRAILSILLTLFAAALVCAATKPKATPSSKPKATPIPKPGDIVGNRKVDCVWVCNYIHEYRSVGYGGLGMFGQLMTPVSYDAKTQATIVLTELAELSISEVEKIQGGRGRAAVSVPQTTDLDSSSKEFRMDGQWSYRASNLRYIDREGHAAPAGPDVTGRGQIHCARGEPFVGKEIFGDIPWEIQHWKTKDGKSIVTFTIQTNIDQVHQDSLAVTVKYHPLKGLNPHRAMRDQDAMVAVDNGKWKSEKFHPHFYGGTLTEPDDWTKPLKVGWGFGSKTSGNEYWQWMFTRTCDNSNTSPPNIYQPPVADLNNVPMYPFPTPTPPPPKLGDKAGDAVNKIVRTGTQQYLDDYRQWVGAEPIH